MFSVDPFPPSHFPVQICGEYQSGPKVQNYGIFFHFLVFSFFVFHFCCIAETVRLFLLMAAIYKNLGATIQTFVVSITDREVSSSRMNDEQNQVVRPLIVSSSARTSPGFFTRPEKVPIFWRYSEIRRTPRAVAFKCEPKKHFCSGTKLIPDHVMVGFT